MLGSENNNADELIISIQVIIPAKKTLASGENVKPPFLHQYLVLFRFEK